MCPALPQGGPATITSSAMNDHDASSPARALQAVPHACVSSAAAAGRKYCSGLQAIDWKLAERCTTTLRFFFSSETKDLDGLVKLCYYSLLLKTRPTIQPAMLHYRASASSSLLILLHRGTAMFFQRMVIALNQLNPGVNRY
jgi:hypothetical protein